MTTTDNGWNEWSRHILKELERLNLGQEKNSEKLQELKDSLDHKLNSAIASIREDLNNVQTRLSQIEPNKIVELHLEVEHLKVRNRDLEAQLSGKLEKIESDVRVLELSQSAFSGKWAIISAVGAVILSAVISMLFSMAKAEPSSQEKPTATKTTTP